jgi:hypothetical protein
MAQAHIHTTCDWIYGRNTSNERRYIRRNHKSMPPWQRHGHNRQRRRQIIDPDSLTWIKKSSAGARRTEIKTQFGWLVKVPLQQQLRRHCQKPNKLSTYSLSYSWIRICHCPLGNWNGGRDFIRSRALVQFLQEYGSSPVCSDKISAYDVLCGICWHRNKIIFCS